MVGRLGGLFNYSDYSWPCFNQKYHGRSGNCLKEATTAFAKNVVGGVGWGWVCFFIIVSPSFNQKYHRRSGNCLKEETRAFKKFVVVRVGGLFDYGVYSWPSYNQKWNLAMEGPV